MAGDTPDDQVTKINTALADTSLDVTAFINATGHLSVRANEYGEDYRVYLLSDLAGGAGTTGVGNVELDDFGTELIGLIGGTKATTINDTTLRGDKGYRTEGIEVTVPDDTSGAAGKVRIVNGLAHRLPEVTKGLTGSRGILRSRSNGVGSRITDLENEIIRQQRRMATKEERLRRQFTSMEVTMGKLEALGDYVSQQIEPSPRPQEEVTHATHQQHCQRNSERLLRPLRASMGVLKALPIFLKPPRPFAI